MRYLTSFLAGRPRNQEELATVRHGPLLSNHCSGTAIIPAEVLLEDPGRVALEYTCKLHWYILVFDSLHALQPASLFSMCLHPLSHLNPYWHILPSSYLLEDHLKKQLTMFEIAERKLAAFMKLRYAYDFFIACPGCSSVIFFMNSILGMKWGLPIWQDGRKDGMNLCKSYRHIQHDCKHIIQVTTHSVQYWWSEHVYLHNSHTSWQANISSPVLETKQFHTPESM